MLNAFGTLAILTRWVVTFLCSFTSSWCFWVASKFCVHRFNLKFCSCMLLGLNCSHRSYRKGLQNMCLNLLGKFGSLRMKRVVEQTFNSVVLREIMSTDVPQLWYALCDKRFQQQPNCALLPWNIAAALILLSFFITCSCDIRCSIAGGFFTKASYSSGHLFTSYL